MPPIGTARPWRRPWAFRHGRAALMFEEKFTEIAGYF